MESADESDLATFARMDKEPGTREFIISYELEDHARSFADPAIVYLRILADHRLAGYFILVPEPDRRSVEFRRIVVTSKGRGIGQQAIGAMERYCRDTLQRKRIWLDVFDHNSRGRHIYEKLGYRRFDSRTLEGRPLLLYEKQL